MFESMKAAYPIFPTLGLGLVGCQARVGVVAVVVASGLGEQ